MEIKTKYNIGDRVWVVYEPTYRKNGSHQFTGEVAVYDTYIESISIEKDGIMYFTEEMDYKEEDLVLYEDKDKLLERIETIMKEIHDRENGNLQST